MDSKMDMSHYSREKLLEEIIRRDEMIASLKQEVQRFRQLFHARKIAVSAETSTKSPHKIIHKDQKTRDIIESAFLVNEFLCQLEQSQIDEIIQSMYPLEAAPESTIIRQGEHGSQLFVLEEGRVQVSKDAQFLRIMEAPCVFGELAILYHCERTATVKALTSCRVWAIERKIFHSINVNAAKSKHNSIFSILKRCRHFTNFSDNCLHLMSDLTTMEEWKHKTEVTSNQLVGRIFLIARGNVIVRRASQFGSPAELQQLHPGDIFGETYRIREMIQALNGLAVTTPSSSTTSQTSSPHRHSCLRPSERYHVDSPDGCQLYTMLVDQICRQLEHTALIEDAALPNKSNEDLSQIELADLKTISTLGIGGFGRVNLVKHVDSDKVFALKILNKAHVKKMNQQDHVLNERNILAACRNDFIVRLHRSFRDSERLYMLMEYCPGGEVWAMLRNWGRFDEQTARFYCAAALEAFDYLHRHFIIYRDLKPENMLLDKNGIPKLADFGFAKCLKSESGRTFTFCGTAEYVAPEIILNKGQSLGVDLWALGIFMYELVSGTPPFASTDPMFTYNSILKGVQSLTWPKYFSESAKSLICKFCRREPAQRLGYGRIEDARRDPWFQGFDFVSFRNHTMRPPIKPKLRSPTDTQNFDRFPSFDNFSSGEDDSGWDFDF